MNQKKIKISQKKIKVLPKKNKTTITEKKFNSLLDINHLEELFFILDILDEKQIDEFIDHYKKSNLSDPKDKKVDLLIKRVKNYKELKKEIQVELIAMLNEEYTKIKQDLTHLRKKGIDVYIEEIKAMAIPLKIKMFIATKEKIDYYKIKKIMADLESPLSKKVKIIDEKNS